MYAADSSFDQVDELLPDAWLAAHPHARLKVASSLTRYSDDPGKDRPIAVTVDGTCVAQLHATTAGAPDRAGRTRGPFRKRPSQV